MQREESGEMVERNGENSLSQKQGNCGVERIRENRREGGNLNTRSN